MGKKSNKIYAKSIEIWYILRELKAKKIKEFPIIIPLDNPIISIEPRSFILPAGWPYLYNLEPKYGSKLNDVLIKTGNIGDNDLVIGMARAMFETFALLK